MKQALSVIGIEIAMAFLATASLASDDHKHGEKPKAAASHDKKHGAAMKDDKAKSAGAAKKDEHDHVKHEHGKPTK